MQVYNDELYHYGKKGMKWGHRIAKPIMNNKAGNKMANTVTNHNMKKDSGYELKFKKHKAAKITASALTVLGTQVVSSRLLSTTGIGDGPRFIVSHALGYLGGRTVANALQDN